MTVAVDFESVYVAPDKVGEEISGAGFRSVGFSTSAEPLPDTKAFSLLFEIPPVLHPVSSNAESALAKSE